MVDYLKEYAQKQYTDAEFESRCKNYTHARPFTKESLLYRGIFEKYYPGLSKEYHPADTRPVQMHDGADISLFHKYSVLIPDLLP